MVSIFFSQSSLGQILLKYCISCSNTHKVMKIRYFFNRPVDGSFIQQGTHDILCASHRTLVFFFFFPSFWTCSFYCLFHDLIYLPSDLPSSIPSCFPASCPLFHSRVMPALLPFTNSILHVNHSLIFFSLNIFLYSTLDN